VTWFALALMAAIEAETRSARGRSGTKRPLLKPEEAPNEQPGAGEAAPARTQPDSRRARYAHEGFVRSGRPAASGLNRLV